jgi:hypothetical protein
MPTRRRMQQTSDLMTFIYDEIAKSKDKRKIAHASDIKRGSKICIQTLGTFSNENKLLNEEDQ